MGLREDLVRFENMLSPLEQGRCEMGVGGIETGADACNLPGPEWLRRVDLKKEVQAQVLK